MMKDSNQETSSQTSSSLLLWLTLTLATLVFIFLFWLKSSRSQTEKNFKLLASSSVKKTKKNEKAQEKTKKSQRTSSSSSTTTVHRWLLTTLKSHKDDVLDLDFSQDKRFLASCSEGDNRKHQKLKRNKKKDEKKNYEEEEEENSKMLVLTHQPPFYSNKFVVPVFVNPSSYHTVMAVPQQRRSRRLPKSSRNLSNAALYQLLRRYIVRPQDLMSHGYPLDVAGKTCAIASSIRASDEGKGETTDSRLRSCCRCQKDFHLTENGEYKIKEKCVYHWGKLHSIGKDSKNDAKIYTCCSGDVGSKGCTTAECHVSLANKMTSDYVETLPCRYVPNDGNFGVCALDCEMCFTVNGLELTRVSLLRVDGCILYDSIVKPESPIVDYNTRFSGLTEKDFEGVVRTLADVQKDLLNLLNADTILVGHALENDLKALRMLHPTIVDTAILFPHQYGLPFRRSLQSLAKFYLRKNIQTSENGHDSYEDARSSLELLLWKLHTDLRQEI